MMADAFFFFLLKLLQANQGEHTSEFLLIYAPEHVLGFIILA